MRDIIMVVLIGIIVCGLLIGVQFLPVSEQYEGEYIKGAPVEVEETRFVAYDTPKRDERDDNFELLANCVYAEAGNQSEYGIRLVCDVILNRAGGKISKIDDVITAPNQFASYSDGGMDRWCDIPENIYRICAEEVRSRTDTKVWFFRTGRFSDYGTPWVKIGAHYFSWR